MLQHEQICFKEGLKKTKAPASLRGCSQKQKSVFPIVNFKFNTCSDSINDSESYSDFLLPVYFPRKAAGYVNFYQISLDFDMIQN